MIFTPTQLLYRAAISTREVKAGEKIITYQQNDIPPAATDCQCWLCGAELNGKGYPKKRVIKDTFTDHPFAKAPHSKTVCEACAYCLSQPSFRNYSIFVEGDKLYHPSRVEAREIILNPPQENPWILCLAVSGQKWLHFKAKVNYRPTPAIVMLEDMPVKVATEWVTDFLPVIEELYQTFTKDEIKSGQYNEKRIRDFGIEAFQVREGKVSKIRGTRFMELLLYIARREGK